MSRLTAAGLGLAGTAVTVAGAAMGYAAWQVQRRPPGDPRDYLQRRAVGPRRPRPVVVCAGASIVRGRASVSWVEMLRERFGDRDFVNAGVNGNLAVELEHRLGDVLACKPDAVIVLVGTNDVQAWSSEAAARATMKAKRLGETPSPDTYRRALAAIVEALGEIGARVALCSLPPLGQDLSSEVNARVREANGIIAEVVAASGAAYLPVGELMAALLAEAGANHGPGFTGSVWPGADSLVRHYVLGQTFDHVAEIHGRLLSPDLIHLNTRGAEVVAELAAGWLAGESAVR